jgi:hypothetical protein
LSRGITRRDKYGFELEEEYSEEEVRMAQRYAEREQERQQLWKNYFDKQTLSATSFLKSIIRKGVPSEYRRQVNKGHIND